jgi:hypothetical protein
VKIRSVLIAFTFLLGLQSAKGLVLDDGGSHWLYCTDAITKICMASNNGSDPARVLAMYNQLFGIVDPGGKCSDYLFDLGFEKLPNGRYRDYKTYREAVYDQIKNMCNKVTEQIPGTADDIPVYIPETGEVPVLQRNCSPSWISEFGTWCQQQGGILSDVGCLINGHTEVGWTWIDGPGSVRVCKLCGTLGPTETLPGCSALPLPAPVGTAPVPGPAISPITIPVRLPVMIPAFP